MAVVVNKPIPEFEAVATNGVKVTQQSHAGQTVVLVTHDPDVAERAPRHVRLRDGKVDHDSAR